MEEAAKSVKEQAGTDDWKIGDPNWVKMGSVWVFIPDTRRKKEKRPRRNRTQDENKTRMAESVIKTEESGSGPVDESLAEVGKHEEGHDTAKDDAGYCCQCPPKTPTYVFFRLGRQGCDLTG